MGYDKSCRDRVYGDALLHRPPSHHVGGVVTRLGTAAVHLRIFDTQGPDHLTQECSLLVLGLDQGEANVRSQQLDRKTGKAGARADVTQAGRSSLGWAECPNLQKKSRSEK